MQLQRLQSLGRPITRHTVGFERSSRAPLLLVDANRHPRMVLRMALADFALTAGRKFTKNFPCRLRASRG